ncbi:MAG: YicC/YloC family endoribonuclease [Pseudomonadota bacterium]
MIKSMTAFSQATHTCDDITAEVTIRSYNSRNLDMALFCPESCQIFEDDIKKIIARTHQRGRVEIRLSLADDRREQDLFEVDEPRVASYYQALKKIKANLGLSEDVSIDHILSAKNMIIPSKKERDTSQLWAAVAPAMESASSQLDQMRRQEGENLRLDLLARMEYIENNIAGIKKDAAGIPDVYKQRLMDRIARLTADTDMIDPVRISQEAAMLADKSDVSEEIERLVSHIKLFKEFLGADESLGRKLNFMIQEFNREFNTIGSKAGLPSLSHRVVDLKSELEKIREQVQNIE